jgi:ABC-type sugar transport system ATPase subunit
MASVRLRNLSRIFAKDFHALTDVSFEVLEKEIVTIVGPSGCGKSTLLRLIAGLDSPTAGTVEIGEQVMNNVPAQHRNIAMVFQSYALYPHMTCFENLALNLRLKKIPRQDIERRVRETAQRLEIEDILTKKPRELSGGQRQRVAVGRALIRNPQAFLFDEPLSNLDALLRERVRHELKELFKAIDATVVYVTHDQVEAMTLADRVVVLHEGMVQQIGTPEALYKAPANRFVASFIGSPSMNLFESQMTQGTFRFGSRPVKTRLDWSGQAIVGIRPENIKLVSSGIPATVRWVEHLGANYLIGVQAGEIVVTLTDVRRPDAENVQIQMESEDIHVFEKNSGTNLSMDQPAPSARV